MPAMRALRYAYSEKENGILRGINRKGRKVSGRLSISAAVVLAFECFLSVLACVGLRVALSNIFHPIVSLLAIPLTAIWAFHRFFGHIPFVIKPPHVLSVVYLCSLYFVKDKHSDRIVLAVLIPFYEEIIYRAIIPTLIYNRIPSTSFASLISVVVFAYVHQWDLTASFAGLCFTLRFLKSRLNLADSFILHLVHNALADPESPTSTAWQPCAFYSAIIFADFSSWL